MNRRLVSLRLHLADRTQDAQLRAQPSPDAATPEAREPAEPPGACGWFDSSHALQHGLQVTEHASADALGPELPLADWLQFHLGGWTAGPVSTPEARTRLVAH